MTVSPLTGLRVLSTRSVMIKPCRNGNLPIQRQVATINTGSDPVPSATEDGMTAAKMDPSLRLHAIRLYKEVCVVLYTQRDQRSSAANSYIDWEETSARRLIVTDTCILNMTHKPR